MLLQNIRQVFVATHRVDFRKGHAGLLAECYRLGITPYEGHVILFIGRCKSKIKVLHCDSNGLWVSYKKFDEDSMKTKIRFLSEPDCEEISSGELAMMIEGNAYRIESSPKSRCKTTENH